jgi:hypothetical protein
MKKRMMGYNIDVPIPDMEHDSSGRLLRDDELKKKSCI